MPLSQNEPFLAPKLVQLLCLRNSPNSLILPFIVHELVSHCFCHLFLWKWWTLMELSWSNTLWAILSESRKLGSTKSFSLNLASWPVTNWQIENIVIICISLVRGFSQMSFEWNLLTAYVAKSFFHMAFRKMISVFYFVETSVYLVQDFNRNMQNMQLKNSTLSCLLIW